MSTHKKRPILVTGGTGTLGRLLVPRLRDAGRQVRVLSRSPHESGEGIEFVTGDLATGDGIERAVEGAEVIVPVRAPGKAGRAFLAGANLCPARAVGERTWEEFLSERVN